MKRYADGLMVEETRKVFKIELTLDVAQCWLDDGFMSDDTSTAEWLKAIAQSVQNMLPYAYPSEFKATARLGDLKG